MLEEVIKDSTGPKKLELYLFELTGDITVKLFSRRYWVAPKVFIEKVKGVELGGVSF